MLRNYLLMAVRNLFKNKVFSLINIIGLGMVIASSIFINSYVFNELNFDTFHEKADRIYRVTVKFISPDEPQHFLPTSNGLKKDLLNFPEVSNVARFYETEANVKIEYENQQELYNEGNFYYADGEVFKIFSYPLLEGNPNSALEMPNSVVLTRGIAEKYFKSSSVLGKAIEINEKNYQVTGVIQDLPNSHLEFGALMSFDSNKPPINDFDFWPFTYLLFNSGVNEDQFRAKLLNFDKKEFSPRLQQVFEETDLKVEHVITPIEEVYLQSDVLFDLNKGTNKQSLITLFLIGIFLMLVAIINSINLMLALSLRRIKEMTIRKISGASGLNVFSIFFFESLLNFAIAFTIAFTLIQVLRDSYFQIIGKEIVLSMFSNTPVLILMLLFVLISSFVTSFVGYFKNRRVSMNSLGDNRVIIKKFNFRDLSLTFQFILGIIILSFVLVTYLQLNFISNKNLGFKKDQVMVIYIPGDVEFDKVNLLVDDLNNQALVKNVSLGNAPGFMLAKSTYSNPNENSNKVDVINFIHADDNYFNLLKIDLIDGVNFNKEKNPLENRVCIINQAFAKKLGWQDPVGKKINVIDEIEIIGVVEDYNYQSLHIPIEPLLIIYSEEKSSNLIVNIAPKNIDLVKASWKKAFPDHVIDYTFLDQSFSQLYEMEVKLQRLLKYFSMELIFLSCMGLFGISSINVMRRIKEIGIRKVLGSTISGVLFLLIERYLSIAAIAIIVALPIAYVLLGEALQYYAYHIDLSWRIFILPGLAMIMLIIITVGYHTLKAAFANPVDSLKYE